MKGERLEFKFSSSLHVYFHDLKRHGDFSLFSNRVTKNSSPDTHFLKGASISIFIFCCNRSEMGLFCIRNVYTIEYIEKNLTQKWSFRLAERLRAQLPDAADTELTELVDKRSDFASKCCSINSPPLYCDSAVRRFDNPLITAQY